MFLHMMMWNTDSIRGKLKKQKNKKESGERVEKEVVVFPICSHFSVTPHVYCIGKMHQKATIIHANKRWREREREWRREEGGGMG